jgi:hypothetical protein
MTIKTAKYITKIHVIVFNLTPTDITITIKNEFHDIEIISLRELKKDDWHTGNWLVGTNVPFTDFTYLNHLYQVISKPTQTQRILVTLEV